MEQNWLVSFMLRVPSHNACIALLLADVLLTITPIFHGLCFKLTIALFELTNLFKLLPFSICSQAIPIFFGDLGYYFFGTEICTLISQVFLILHCDSALTCVLPLFIYHKQSLSTRMLHTFILLTTLLVVKIRHKHTTAPHTLTNLPSHSTDGICIFEHQLLISTNNSMLLQFDCASKNQLLSSMHCAKTSDGITLISLINLFLQGRPNCLDYFTDFTIWNKGRSIHILAKGLNFVIEDKAYQALITTECSSKAEQEKSNLISIFKSMLVSSFSHDLRTPLNIIISELCSIKDMDLLPQSTISLLYNNASIIQYLTQDMIDFMELECNTFTLRRVLFNVEACINEVVELFSNDIIAKGLKVSICADSSLVIIADKSRTCQILINLLSNAIKYSLKDGCITITVTTHNKINGKRIKVKLADNGLGINKVTQSKLFDLFSQRSIQNKEFKTAGFGLFFCKKLANRMGGNIKVISKENEGSMFTFSVPYDVGKLKVRSNTKLAKTDSETRLSNSFYPAKPFSQPKSKNLDDIAKFKVSPVQSSCEFNSDIDEPLASPLKRSPTTKILGPVSSSSMPVIVLPPCRKRTICKSKFNLKMESSYNSSIRSSVMSVNQLYPNLESSENISTKIRSSCSIQIDKVIKNCLSSFNRNCGCPLIMAVDDNMLNLNAFARLASILGVDSCTENSGIDAIKTLEKYNRMNCCNGIRIILMDLDMPRMNGLEATAIIREKIAQKLIKEAVIVILSAYSKDDKELTCLANGAKEYSIIVISIKTPHSQRT